jgi:hypothetical protein
MQKRITSTWTTAMALLWASAAASAQAVNPTNSNLSATAAAAPAAPKGGFEIGSVSAYSVYYSSSLPNNGGLQTGITSLSSDLGYGGSVTIDWTKFTERTRFALSYTPAYTGQVRYSSVNALNHLFSLNLSRKLTHRLTFGFTTGANVSTYEQALTAPNSLSGIASVPASFNDFAGALLASKFANNPLLGVAFTNPALAASPVSTLLYGQQMLTASGTTSLSYSYTPRSSISITGGGTRTQPISSNQGLNSGNSYIIQNTSSATAGFSFSYSLTPLSQLGWSLNTVWVSTPILGSYTTTSTATFGRTFNRRWVVQLHGGVGKSRILHSTSAQFPTEPRPVYGGSLAYKTPTGTFIGTYDRTTIDSYGLGASTTSTSNATWLWRRPGRTWWIDASLGWQELSGSAVSTISGWHTTAGLNRALGTHAIWRVQYAYLTYSGDSPAGLSPASLNAAVYSSSQSAVQLSLTWIPRTSLTQITH